MACGIVLITAVIFPTFYQPMLTTLYNYLYSSTFYQLSTFETIVTVVSYGIIEPKYTTHFAHNPELRIDVRPGTLRVKSKRSNTTSSTTGQPDEDSLTMPKLPKMKRPSKRLGEILRYVSPLLLLDLTMIKKFADTPVDDIRVSGGYAPVATTATLMSTGSSRSINTTADAPLKSISGSFLLPTLHNFTRSTPLQLRRALPPVPPTSRRLVLELAASFFIYDMLFFLCHLCFHHVPFLARHHLPHHKHHEIHPQVTNQLSIVERLCLVLLANFSLNIIKSHVVTRTIFIPIFVTLLIQVHSGMDLRWGYDKFLPRGWASGSRGHARHHRTGEGVYAPFFTWWDRILGMAKMSSLRQENEKTSDCARSR
ncbi:hypothetical protein PV08_09563 [Exophiala spinifera]|uniref:Fatty acid hydroxylase domain-containing protein n=1 Tax=Exophiala spinifera TaxID=91928 RepID=A0A0D1YBH4_9EURO|nr:uncharacterized protein PV08_09563 [Exophiala spinifera]KIW12286.1 hypothetical protein PV08_09563 [Exophiala spinifera]